MSVRAVPEKIFMGFDASGDRKVTFKNDRYFTIVAVTCSDFKEAQRIAIWLEQRWPDKRRKDLYSHWRGIVEKLRSADLRYYILLVDKVIFSGRIDGSNYNRMKFPEAEFDEDLGTSKYTTIKDLYAKHGWLVIEVLNTHGYEGPTEIRWDSDEAGEGWELAKKKVKDHAENHLGHGLCDLRDSGMEYPLVRIADTIAYFAHRQLKERTDDDKLTAISLLRSNVCVMWLDFSRSFVMHCGYFPGFKPW